MHVLFNEVIEYVGKDKIQDLMHSFYQVIGVANAVVDMTGKVVVQVSWQDVCVKFHSKNIKTCTGCVENDDVLVQQMAKNKKYTVYHCANGLVKTAAPIFVNDEHVANIFTGQFFTEPPNLELFYSQALEQGFNPEDYLESIKKLPVVSLKRSQSITELYVKLISTLISHGLDKLSEQNSQLELNKINAELKQQLKSKMTDLVRSEVREKTIIDASPVPKMLINSQERIVYLNPAFTKVFGYSAEDIPALEAWFEHAYPDIQRKKAVRDFWKFNLHLFLYGQKALSKLERTVQCKDGFQRDVLIDMAVIDQYKNEKVIMVVFNDVTDIHQANAIVKQKNQFLQSILEAEPECVMIIDHEGHLKEINPAGLSCFEVDDIAQIKNLGILNFIEDNFKNDFKILSQRVYNGQSGVLEFSILGAKKTKRWLECHATPVKLNNTNESVFGMLAVSRDITERKHTELELFHRNHYLWLNNLVLKKLGENLPMKVILDEMMTSIEDCHLGTYSSVLLVDKNNKYLIQGAAPSLPQYWVEKIARVPIGEGIGSCGTAAYRGEPVIVEDISTHPYWAAFREDALMNGLRACWSQPIKNAAGKVLGTFAIYLRRVAAPTAAEISLLEDYAQLAQLVIERSRLTEALLETQHLYQLIAHNSTDVIWVLELPSLRFSYISPSVKYLRGWEAEEVIEHSIYQTFTPNMLAAMQEALTTHLKRLANGDKTARIGSIELELLHKDGHPIPVETAFNIILNDQGEPIQIIGSSRDISERKAAEAIIRNMAFYDRLTNLPNRRMLEDRLHQLIRYCQRLHSRMAMLFIDLDKFKPVNDQYGHTAGDWLLKQVSQRMLSVLRKTDTVARVGGDEFVVLLPDAKIAEHALNIAEKIRLELERPFVMNTGITLSISSSIGVVMYPENADNSRDLLRFGDEAMYYAKKGGRNKIELFKNPAKEIIPNIIELIWHDEFLCGQSDIDAEHQEILKKASHLLQLSAQSRTVQTEVMDALDQLLDDVAHHFAHEEIILAQFDYEDLQQHVEQHAHLLEQAQLLKEQVERGEISLKGLIEYVISDVIVGHLRLLGADKKFFYLFSKAKTKKLNI
ncbi:diguanylate cyclase [Acinetobacter sp. ANC 5584]